MGADPLRDSHGAVAAGGADEHLDAAEVAVQFVKGLRLSATRPVRLPGPVDEAAWPT